MGGLAEQEGKGIAYVDLKDAFFGKNPAWRQAKDPHGAFIRMVAADEICLQPCFRRKQEAAKASDHQAKMSDAVPQLEDLMTAVDQLFLLFSASFVFMM
uniref:Uncharacterized protein n=1 Tax=Chromera velia CCMP2878 TaxID=1169474 RepID=A0A0G4EZ78_9ALVE|eukprot:Cvel_14312.t1-p1 / transcript=Cvel_14312.t1 / gene=Cvel_14312 / organism=Chromera_velia_CCMP2878 / gene_product=hypothetical protein / transcript_product=hypothetical protein / location=Cvel_scaffold1012:18095-20842(+) / protein_length=98 / sequence_SO=supercontig / SO=protein_coding / is_pseudo=false